MFMKKYNVVASAMMFIAFISCNVNLEEGAYVSKQVSVDSSEDYYWYHGLKIPLIADSSQWFCLKEIKSTANSVSIDKDAHKSLCDNILNKNAKGPSIIDKRISWSISRQSTRLSQEDIVYASPSYISMDNDTIFISHLFYVKLKNEFDYEKLKGLASKYKVDIIRRNEDLPLWYTLGCSSSSPYSALRMSTIFYETGLFAASEPDIMVDLSNSTELTAISSYTPNDFYYGNQWNLKAINWADAYLLSTGENVQVGIIDQGMENLHPDYNKVPQGFDTLNPTWDSQNIVYGSHGTCCAGIIYATVNNNIGISGMADKVNMYSVCHPLTARPNAIEELTRGLAIAIHYSDVVSCSWGSSDLKSTQIEDAISYYMKLGRNDKGTVVVFSAGNDKSDVAFPANCNDDILVVGSIGKKYKRSSFSNFGTQLDVVAPGEYIPTTDLLKSYGYDKSDYYMKFDGTSAACPHVAATAAMVISANPQLTGKQVRDIIESTAQKVGGYSYKTTANRDNGTWNNEMGYGLINVYAAVVKAINMKKVE